MTYVYYTEITKNFQKHLFSEHLATLPKIMKEKIKRYRKWEDQQAILLGKLLIRKGFHKLNYTGDPLRKIKYTYYNRPFINDTIDFNISHSGSYVICAINTMHKIGVDIQEIKPVDFSAYKSQMMNEEWYQINKAKSKTKAFYEYWTKKEAVIKANGKGLSIPLQSFTVKDSVTKIENSYWYTLPIHINPDSYCCHLASNQKIKQQDVVMIPVSF